jgi:hypothetical protein
VQLEEKRKVEEAKRPWFERENTEEANALSKDTIFKKQPKRKP